MKELPTTPKKFNRPCLERVIENLAQGMQTHPAIEKAGISVRHFYRELKKRPSWAKDFKDAQVERDQIRNEQRIEAAEAEVYRRAVEGWEQQTYDEHGQVKSSRRRYSDPCLIFLLRKLAHQRYGDHPSVINNTVQISRKDETDLLREWRKQLGASS
jgi:hypothetical protein